MHSPVLKRIFADPAPSDHGLQAATHTLDGAGNTIEPLGRASVQLVDQVCSRIAAQQARSEARLADLMEKLDAEEERTKRLDERVNQAENAALEAELWLTRLTDALETKIMRRQSQAGALVIGA